MRDAFETTLARYRAAGSEAERGALVGELFAQAFAAHGARAPTARNDGTPGTASALLELGRSVAVGARQQEVLTAALKALRIEVRSLAYLRILADLALLYPMARPLAWAEARDELAARTPRRAPPELARRAAVEAMATLLGAAHPQDAAAQLREMMTAADRSSYPPYAIPSLLARAHPGLAQVGDATLLEVATATHPFYRALTLATLLPALTQAGRELAIAAALSNPADPSLGDARPWLRMAPYLAGAPLERAIGLAAQMPSTPSFGATALVALLPRWAQEGHATQATEIAQRLVPEVERGVALARIGVHLPTQEAALAMIGQGLALLARSGAGVSQVAADLVPLGLGLELRAAAGRGQEADLFALALVSKGEARAQLIQELSLAAAPAWLWPLLPELSRSAILKRFCEVLARATEASAGEFFENETGEGLGEWMPAVWLLGGDVATCSVLRTLSAQGSQDQ